MNDDIGSKILKKMRVRLRMSKKSCTFARIFESMANKRKIINDPVFGFLTIPNELVFDVLQHPYVQRLSRIRQLGLSYLVYPGAMHSRFGHSIGAMHLMQEAIHSLRMKGVEITEAEETSAMIAILLHDIGHGPFSHVLEHTLVDGVTHEDISLLMMERINEDLYKLRVESLELREVEESKAERLPRSELKYVS